MRMGHPSYLSSPWVSTLSLDLNWDFKSFTDSGNIKKKKKKESLLRLSLRDYSVLHFNVT